jgi:hypothetical protein
MLFYVSFTKSRFASDRKCLVQTVTRRTGLGDRRTDDLRATFASRANSCHATSLTVVHLLGHDSTQVFPAYVKTLDENTKAVIEALDAARTSQSTLSRFMQQVQSNLGGFNCQHQTNGDLRLQPARRVSAGNCPHPHLMAASRLSRFHYSTKNNPFWGVRRGRVSN